MCLIPYVVSIAGFLYYLVVEFLFLNTALDLFDKYTVRPCHPRRWSQLDRRYGPESQRP